MLESSITGGDGADDLGALLSTREAEVLSMATLGLTNAQIAQRMHLSVHAVKFHLAGVYRKLRVANRTEAVVVFLRARPDQTVEAPSGGLAPPERK